MTETVPIRQRMTSGAAAPAEGRESPLPGIARQMLDPRDPAWLALGNLRPARVGIDIARCYALIAVAWALGSPPARG